jgi:hypothetical protein
MIITRVTTSRGPFRRRASPPARHKTTSGTARGQTRWSDESLFDVRLSVLLGCTSEVIQELARRPRGSAEVVQPHHVTDLSPPTNMSATVKYRA